MIDGRIIYHATGDHTYFEFVGDHADSPEVIVRAEMPGWMADELLVLLRYAMDPDHYLVVGADASWVLEHSLSCRQAGTMSSCVYHVEAQQVAEELNAGRYKLVHLDDDTMGRTRING